MAGSSNDRVDSLARTTSSRAWRRAETTEEKKGRVGCATRHQTRGNLETPLRESVHVGNGSRDDSRESALGRKSSLELRTGNFGEGIARRYLQLPRDAVLAARLERGFSDPLLLFHNALERELTLPCQLVDGSHLGLGYFERIDAGDTHAILMNVKHDAGGLGVRLVKDCLEQLDHELHRRVVIIKENHFVERRLCGLRLRLGAPLGYRAAIVRTTVVVVADSSPARRRFDPPIHA